MKLEQFFKAKTAGLPRWAWAGLLTAAVVAGLYLRNQQNAGSGEEEGVEGSVPNEGELGYYNGTESAGGLAAAGLVGPASGSISPVEAPYIPEGFIDMFASLTDLVREQGAYITEHPSEKTTVITEPSLTGGGAPEAPIDYSPPSSPTGTPKPQSNCSATDRNNIGRLTNEIQDLNNQLDKIDGELNRLNQAFSNSKNATQKNQIRQKITQEQARRNQVQGSRASKVQTRDALQKKCS